MASPAVIIYFGALCPFLDNKALLGVCGCVGVCVCLATVTHLTLLGGLLQGLRADLRHPHTHRPISLMAGLCHSDKTYN